AQGAGLVEIGTIAGAREAAVATLVRGFLGEGALKEVAKASRAAAEAARDCRQCLGQTDAGSRELQPARARGSACQAVAHRGEIPRAPALQGQARNGPGDVGSSPERGPEIHAQRLVLAQEAHGVETPADAVGVAQRAGEAGSKLARSGAR